ncbi:hypothetical protein [Candidatus Uabimicrobium sp. HlEnr_7]|uniref:hypothetical protein n=1 Tax=Candidatus Uabimicrobium helgolandensis TaxID=3095367 RepID=UPI0035560544
MSIIIGIRAEELDTRAPLTPKYVKRIVESGTSVYVQPSQKRCFPDEEYQKAGAYLQTDLSNVDIVFSVKEIPCSKILPGKIHCFFSHTIKGQKNNMTMLRTIMEKQATLIDYEKITDSSGKRLIAFGKFAGYAGMIDALWIYGQRMQTLGCETPFSQVQQANKYQNLEQAKTAISDLGKTIKEHGLPFPIVCGFTGSGRVAQGAKEIYSLLPVRTIMAKDLSKISENVSHHCVYQVSFSLENIFTNSQNTFSREEYIKHPQQYHSIFAEYIPYLSIVVNGLYWAPKYPHLLTILDLKNLLTARDNPRFQTLADITCDINGSIEFNVESTSSENPCYTYNPFSKKAEYGWKTIGLPVLAVDKLPGEIPQESSEGFSEELYGLFSDLRNISYAGNLASSGLSATWHNATIVYKGELTENYQYLQKHLEGSLNE